MTFTVFVMTATALAVLVAWEIWSESRSVQVQPIHPVMLLAWGLLGMGLLVEVGLLWLGS